MSVRSTARGRRGARPTSQTTSDVDRAIENLRQLSQKIAKDMDEAIKALQESMKKLEESLSGGGR
ncbi:MAG: hypothetical protein DRJ96_05320 [Thermoprotei archaeon]|nr:MAG: hypothetical protein DRJ96_05320 [Thermoprotei archaeon]